MSVTWSRCKRSAGIYFHFGGWDYQLQSKHFVCRAVGGGVMMVGGYR